MGGRHVDAPNDGEVGTRVAMARRQIARLQGVSSSLRERREQLRNRGGSTTTLAALDEHLVRLAAQIEKHTAELEGLTESAPSSGATRHR